MDSCHPKQTLKWPSPTAKHFASDGFVRRMKILERGPTNLKTILKQGYSKQQLNLDVQRALDTSREACLQSQHNQDKTARIPLVVTYHPILPTFYSTTKGHLSILHTSERLRGAFSLPPLIAFCRPKNLRDLLVRATLTSTVYIK